AVLYRSHSFIYSSKKYILIGIIVTHFYIKRKLPLRGVFKIFTFICENQTTVHTDALSLTRSRRADALTFPHSVLRLLIRTGRPVSLVSKRLYSSSMPAR